MEELKKEIKRLYENGMRTTEIVRSLPCSINKARLLLSEMKANGELSKRTIAGQTWTRISMLLEQGYDKKRISEELCIPIRTINHHLFNHNIRGEESAKYNIRKRNQSTYDIIEELKKGEKTYAEIGRQFGFSRQYVHKLANELKEQENERD